jgi:hypothetical protein
LVLGRAPILWFYQQALKNVITGTALAVGGIKIAWQAVF